ncbi:MAG: antibiotic biosynthesis monooxygenase [Pseudomonadota bacterium]
MIVRIWQGWTTHDNADEYEQLLTTEIIPEIRLKGIPGLMDVEVFRRETENETEFMTRYCFDDMDSIKSMAGSDPEKAYVPDKAQKLLKRFETSARHFQKKF